MKIAIPIQEHSLESKISAKFARSPYFVLVEKELKTFEIIESDCLTVAEKVGYFVAEKLFNKHQVDAIVAYELGVKLQQFAHDQQIQLIIIDNKHRCINELLTFLKIEIKV